MEGEMGVVMKVSVASRGVYLSFQCQAYCYTYAGPHKHTLRVTLNWKKKFFSSSDITRGTVNLSAGCNNSCFVFFCLEVDCLARKW